MLLWLGWFTLGYLQAWWGRILGKFDFILSKNAGWCCGHMRCERGLPPCV